jgi:hypothetical protein
MIVLNEKLDLDDEKKDEEIKIPSPEEKKELENEI